jgi:Domain of unknown function (DUF4440)
MKKKTGTAGAEKTNTAEETLKELERQAREASLSNNSEFFDKLIANDFLGIDPKGEITDKPQTLERRRLGKMIFHSITADDIRVRIYGNTAIVTGHTEVRGRHEGRDVAGDYRYTRVYLRKAGSWRVVSSQSTRITS